MEKFYLFLVLGVTVSFASAAYMDAVSRVKSKGKSVYIPVKRELLQGIIDTFAGPTLYMPEGPVLADQPEGTHPLIVDVAEITFLDFVESEADNPKSYVSTFGIEVTVDIPNLALTPTGPTTYTLGVAVLYDGTRRGIPQPDFLYKYTPVEKITVHGDVVTVVDRTAEITIDLAIDAPCDDAASEPIEQRASAPGLYSATNDINVVELLKRMDDSTDVGGDDTAMEPTDDLTGFIFSLGLYPDENFCWYYPAGTRFCDDVHYIGYVVDHWGANICTVWDSENEKFCTTTAGEVKVSGWFRDIIPIDQPTKALTAEQYNGDYNIGLQFPCVDVEA